jgi:hypothetical protein
MAAVAKRRLSAADKRARDGLILDARSNGMTWTEIGKRFALSERAAQRAAASAARLAAETGLAEVDAAALMETVIRGQTRAFYRLEELVMADNPAVALGAARAVGKVGADLCQSLRAVGLWPLCGDEALLLRGAADMTDAIIEAAKEVGVPVEHVAEALKSRPAIANRISLVRTD